MVRFRKYWNDYFRECVKSFNIALDCALYVLPVGRQDFGSVNPEFRIIEGRITEVLLYYLHISVSL